MNYRKMAKFTPGAEPMYAGLTVILSQRRFLSRPVYF